MYKQKQAIKRRINVDSSQKKYACGCGKAYLSHPALYLHKKQKHNGISPSGAIIPSKNLQNHSKPPKNLAKILNINLKQFAIMEEIDEENAIDDFYIYLSGQESIAQSLIQPVLDGTIDPIKKFPISILQSLKCDYKSLFLSIQELYSTELKLPQINNKTNLRSSSFDNLIAFFLLRIYKDLTEKCYHEIVVLLSLLKDTIEKTNDNINYQESIEVPKMCANFLDNNWKQIWNAFGVEFQNNYKFKLLGPDYQQFKNGQFIIQYFMNWIRSTKFSKQQFTIVNTNLDESEFSEEEIIDQNPINSEEYYLNQFLNI